MLEAEASNAVGPEAMRRFWRTAFGFWSRDTAWISWGLIALLVVCVVLQLLNQYWLNVWNRDFFNALERRDGREIWHQTHVLMVLAAQSIALAVFAVWGRMSFQRLWRRWLTSRLVEIWLSNGNYRRIDAGGGEHQLAEYRIAEDARVATDAPIDLLVGLLSSILTAGTFVVVLWTVGGSIDLRPFGVPFQLPGFLVFAAMIYAAMTTGAMVLIGHNMAYVIERKNQAESELKFAVAHLRERATAETPRPDPTLVTAVADALKEVIQQWRRVVGQHMRTTLVSHGNTLLAPLVGLILCVPNYVQGTMLLGEVTQAAAAFVAVQGLFNWLVDNYPRLAEWVSSASRVGTLLCVFDRLDDDTAPHRALDLEHPAT
jgi:vitamin B12/bleomycin/antimicrobial peptide transport system ATP-binding/permease protein